MTCIHCIQSTLYILHCTRYTVHFTLYTIRYTLYTIHYSLYTVHFTLYTIYYSLYTVHYTLCILYYMHKIYTLHRIHLFIITPYVTIVHIVLNIVHFKVIQFTSWSRAKRNLLYICNGLSNELWSICYRYAILITCQR